MAIKGNLEDLPIVDVIQLLHVAKRSGTLRVESGEKEASVICRDGDIIGAIHPSPDINIGRLLVADKAVTDNQVDEAVSHMNAKGAIRKPLMATLIELGYLEKEDGWRALRQLIHGTLAEIISWKSGTFFFELDKFDIDDDFRHMPSDILEGGGVDIKGALLEALRIFDERNREQKERVSQQDGGSKQAAREDDDVPIKELSEDSASERVESLREVIFICTDGLIKNSVKAICKKERMFSFVSGLEKDILAEVEQCYADGVSTIVAADLSFEAQGGLGPKKRISMIKRLKAQRPEIPLVAFSSNLSHNAYSQAFSLGARTLIPLPKQTGGNKEQYLRHMKQFFAMLMSCLDGVFHEADQLRQTALESRMQITSLKRRVQEIQDRKTSPDVSLVVLQYMAEFLERGIIFLVRKNDLLGIGSFGVDGKGDTISTTAMRLKVPLLETSIFRQVARTGMVFKGTTDDQMLKDMLYSKIGEPSSNDILLLPLKTENQTRAIVYGDFGRKEPRAVKTDVFEILASQAGMAIELALQRARASGRPSVVSADPSKTDERPTGIQDSPG